MCGRLPVESPCPQMCGGGATAFKNGLLQPHKNPSLLIIIQYSQKSGYTNKYKHAYWILSEEIS